MSRFIPPPSPLVAFAWWNFVNVCVHVIFNTEMSRFALAFFGTTVLCVVWAFFRRYRLRSPFVWKHKQ